MVALIGCITLICATVAALFALNIAYERATAIDVARRATSNLAESLARQGGDAFAATDCALFGLAERAQTEGPDLAARTRLSAWMAMQVTMVPRMNDMLVIDARGRRLASSASAAVGPVTDPWEVTYFRAHTDAGARISWSRQSREILVSRRFNHADGSFGGIVVAAIRSEYFGQIYAGVDVGKRGIIALLANDERLMARNSIAVKMHRDTLELRAAATARSGTYYSDQPDNVRRMFAFRRLDGYPLTVVVAAAESEYLAGWRAAAVMNSVALLLVIVLVGALAVLLRLQTSRRKRAEETLARLALLDELTGLANRRQFDAVLNRETRRARRERTTLGLLMIDVDNFKAYNDLYGHLQGDDALVAVAGSLAETVDRGGDFAARFGGEEFVVVLPATSLAGAYAVGEQIRMAIAALTLPHAGSAAGFVTVSIGVAVLAPGAAMNPALLLQSADEALYAAKRGGRNQTAMMRGGADAPTRAANEAGHTTRDPANAA